MTEEELQRWFARHEGYAGKKENRVTIPGSDYAPGRPATAAQRIVESVTYEAMDGATITVKEPTRRVEGTAGPDLVDAGVKYQVTGETAPKPERTPPARTPEQIRSDTANATKTEFDNAEEVRKNNERSWNQQNSPAKLPETHLERATREAKEAQTKRDQEKLEEERRRSDEESRARREESAADRASRERQANRSAELTQQQIDIQRAAEDRAANKPDFLNQADTKTPYTSFYNPQTRQIEHVSNPNFSRAKAEAEERRAELASQVQAGQLSLDAAKQQYTQWFDTNVRVPLMQAQEERARAEERRQALDAEERRRQFAADYRLRKATLGETAAQRATSAEISLLPYRSGPTWGADISSAINSLAGGGRMDANAAAGIHFSDSSFAFSRPDFKQIARDAAKAALSGLTDYRPSEDSYAVGDYSGIPQVNVSGMPQYTYTPVSLPAPSAGADLPPE